MSICIPLFNMTVIIYSWPSLSVGLVNLCWAKWVPRVKRPLLPRFMGPTWGPSGADRTQVGPMLAPWILLHGTLATPNLLLLNQYRPPELWLLMVKVSDAWWCHQMETFSTLLALCAGNSPVTGEFPSQRPGTQSFGVFFDLLLNKRLSKQSRRWWFGTPSHSLWRYCNEPNTDPYVSRSVNQHTVRPQIKWSPICRRYFKIEICENRCISIRISRNCVLNAPINNKPALVQIMDWRRAGDKPFIILSNDYGWFSFLRHACVTRPRWV